MFAGPPGPIPPGERAEAHITILFSGDSGPWPGRRVKVSILTPADVVAEPAEAEVTLDADGGEVVRVFIVPAKTATPGPRTLAITATGSDTVNSTLMVDVTVP